MEMRLAAARGSSPSLCSTCDETLTLSSTATAPNLPGAGRTLGRMYDFLGQRLEEMIISMSRGRSNHVYLDDDLEHQSFDLLMPEIPPELDEPFDDVERVQATIDSNIGPSARAEIELGWPAIINTTDYEDNRLHAEAGNRMKETTERHDPPRKVCMIFVRGWYLTMAH